VSRRKRACKLSYVEFHISQNTRSTNILAYEFSEFNIYGVRIKYTSIGRHVMTSLHRMYRHCAETTAHVAMHLSQGRIAACALKRVGLRKLILIHDFMRLWLSESVRCAVGVVVVPAVRHASIAVSDFAVSRSWGGSLSK